MTASPARAQDAGAGSGTVVDSVADSDSATAPAADTVSATDSAADTVSATDSAAEIRPTLPPKIAVVVAGDPDDTLRSIAASLEIECKLDGLRTPADGALSDALRGEPAIEDDGLEGLRSIRRGVGVDPERDLASYKRLGLIAGADALVVVRREGVILVEVFDVSAARFYEGKLEFDTSSKTQRLGFIRSRAAQAQLRWSEPPPTPAAEPAAKEPSSEANPKSEKDQAEESRAKRRWKKAWPYVVAGALLAGGVTYLIIDGRRTDVAAPPLLRFRPGE